MCVLGGGEGCSGSIPEAFRAGERREGEEWGPQDQDVQVVGLCGDLEQSRSHRGTVQSFEQKLRISPSKSRTGN